MPSLGEKSLFQEGSHSGTSDPSHKGDSFSSFQGFKGTCIKCLGWREAHLLPLPCNSLSITRNPYGTELLLSVAGNVNAVRIHKHSPVALGRMFCT